MGLFDILKRKENVVMSPETQEPKNTQGHKVAGCDYRQAEIKSLGKINPDYSLKKNELIKKKMLDIKVYEYIFPKYSAELVPEPTNEHDPNAIKVIIDGVHVGYIKKGSCTRIHNLINSGGIKGIEAILYGGNYKEVLDCGDVTEFDHVKGNIKIRLEIEYE